MKHSEKKYAKLLFDLLKGKSGQAAKNVVGAFAELLAERNELNRAEKIAGHFNDIWNREKGIIEAKVITARETEKNVLSFFNKYIVSQTGAKEVEISAKTDGEILGGAILRFGDKVLDASLKTQLIELKNKISK